MKGQGYRHPLAGSLWPPSKAATTTYTNMGVGCDAAKEAENHAY